MWLLTGLILFLITLYVQKHTYKVKIKRHHVFNEVSGKYENKIELIKIPIYVWEVLLCIIIYAIPIVNIIAFIMGVFIYIMEIGNSSDYTDSYMFKLKEGDGFYKFIKFLNKDLNK